MIELQTITLTLADGKPIQVVVAHLAAWIPSDEGTLLLFVGGGTQTVSEDFDLVSEMLNPEQQAGC
ncbi:hypothetical protein HNO88_003731 [Novosphingobium chloroacetimidivorans]|uniref:Uncharacterized protein n=1 Tax=Novosphingobium chloroacetimidivorans TaxID=1428314 RepID=A0A7W7KE34_9SPHN|nr:hypothetical protein [Novosphingobium chloroacetimidivorans]MBB4860388.1 hypothetical protein [Novosphingobium chloroacetimidivorans]